jgi:hypothetical protein
MAYINLTQTQVDSLVSAINARAKLNGANFTGPVSGTTFAGSFIGNADTATKLATPRTINGVAFDGTADITFNVTDSIPRIATSEKGVANGVATLDANALIPASQLPSYVDDVLEFSSLSAFPTTGETGKIYVALDTNNTYRWSGTVYIYITSGAVNSVAGKTGVVTLVKADVGLDLVDNTPDINKNVLSAASAAKLTTARNIAITGDATGTVSFDGSANVSITTTLSNSGVTAGNYNLVTVDDKGRVTAGAIFGDANIGGLI